MQHRVLCFYDYIGMTCMKTCWMIQSDATSLITGGKNIKSCRCGQTMLPMWIFYEESIKNKQFTVGELEEVEIKSEEENSVEKTTKPRNTRQTTGSRVEAEGKNQFKYNTRIGVKNLKIDSNPK
ncbi:hypothetical protein HHI36_019922 [Cryptolaemus montrouzieri]|uniref:Uncharacterized protein n=1 Tax=Cryptolaemus montrouzieri TaxID=559131 RepID=A0ABD2N938_9CUCU